MLYYDQIVKKRREREEKSELQSLDLNAFDGLLVLMHIWGSHRISMGQLWLKTKQTLGYLELEQKKKVHFMLVMACWCYCNISQAS